MDSGANNLFKYGSCWMRADFHLPTKAASEYPNDNGSMDNKNAQEKIINIMEGVQEAFNRRKGVCQIWKS